MSIDGSVEHLIVNREGAVDGWNKLYEFASFANSRDKSSIEMYGFGTILRRLCFLPRWFPIRVRSQHGVSLWTVPPDHDLQASERLLFVHSPRWVEIFKSHGRQGVVAIGSPFVMFRRHVWGATHRTAAEPRSAIFYLSHSTFWEKVSWDSDQLLDLLQQIRTQEGSLTVCVHFVDILNGLAKTIYEAGFDIATAGNYFNTEFPKNFYALLLGHRTVYTNAVGSHVFYAVEAGKEVRWVELPHEYFNIGYSDQIWSEFCRTRPIEMTIIGHMRAGAAARKELEMVCRDELGIDSIPSRFEILTLIVISNIDWYFVRKLKMIYWRFCRLAFGK